MKVFTHTQFTGRWPVGTAAVIVAVDKEDALNLLNDQLRSERLKGDAEADDLQEVSTTIAQAIILCDGDY